MTFDEVWRYGLTNPYIDSVMPYAVKDRAISNWGEQSPERMIVHYLCLHHPHGSNAVKENPAINRFRERPMERTQRGNGKRGSLGCIFDDLRQGLDAVEMLVEDIDAENIVITADQGDAFSEYGIYSHPILPIPPLRKVPWVST